MAGLDTRGMMDGFAQGFGLMQNYQDGKDRKAYLQQQQDMQQRGLDMREQEFAAQQEDRREQKDLQFAQNWWQQAAIASETQNPDMFPVWDEQTQVRLGRSGMLNPAHLLRPETEAAVQYADKLANGEGSLFSKQTVEAMNDFYAPRVSLGNGGKKRLAGMYPGQKEGSFVFELEVEDEQGNKRLAPMTVNRGIAGEDDEIAQYSIEDAIKPVMGVKQLYGAFGKNMDFVRKMGQMQGWLPKAAETWEQVQGPGGSLLQRNAVTGEMKALVGRESRDSAAAAASQPSAARKQYNELIELGESPDNARKLAYGGAPKISDQLKQEAQLEEIGNAYEQSGYVLAAVDDLLSPDGQQGIDAASGMSSYLPSRRGGAAYNAEQKLDQLTSMLQLENMGSMKGVLSDSDMKVIRAASSGLEIGLSTDQIKERLSSIRQKLEAARTRTRSKAEAKGVDLAPYSFGATAQPASQPAHAQPAASRSAPAETGATDFSSLWGG